MKLKAAFGIIAALLFVLAIAAGVHYEVLTMKAALLVLTCFGPFGAVTVSNLYPFTSAPTVAQGGVGRSYNSIVATVATTATGDNSAAITHQFGLANAEISQGFPFVTFVPQADGTTGAWFEASQNPNYTILGSNQLIAVRATTKVIISAPHTYGR